MTDLPIVGIGSSAGGLQALEKFFRAMPADSGLAFVVAQHLDPTHDSIIDELLSRWTTMPVQAISQDTAVEPGCVYVIAPDQDLRMQGGVLRPEKPSAPRGPRRSIDIFLRSLAEDRGEQAIAIILSGTGTDGSDGIRFVKSHGGVALAQDPETAGYDGMPRAAIATGIVDVVLPPEKMPEALLGVVRHGVPEPAAAEADRPGDERSVDDILASLAKKQDFRCYKRGTVMRRVHRRMGFFQIRQLGDYLEKLRKDPQEVDALVRDLNIAVTSFFRDPEAWEVVDKQVIAPLVQQRQAGSTIRVWVPACATGEEALTIAMLFLERAQAAEKTFDYKIFATDVTEQNLPLARAGVFPASIAADVAAGRLDGFFEPHGAERYRIRRVVREMVTFAPHNVLRDPPFAMLDMVSCRNLLIYLEPDTQKKLLTLFHYALVENGALFLGPSETIAGRDDLFQPISKKWRIYRRTGATRRDLVEFPLAGRRAVAEETAPAVLPLQQERASEQFHRALLARYAPASVLIDRRLVTLAFHGSTSNYLQQPGGEPTNNLIALARDGLQGPLRTAIKSVIADGRAVSAEARVKNGTTYVPVTIAVAPLTSVARSDPLMTVSFLAREAPLQTPAPSPDGRSAVQDLEAELEAARRDQRLTIEQMEASSEELKASNEEIRSINEEMQATNEELETSKEELQSLNEELTTVNVQLETKIGELEVRTNDLNNLLNSAAIATLFLDRELRIRWFTPSMNKLLDLVPTDVGRPITVFAQRFTGGGLVDDAEIVLDRLSPRDAEVCADDGLWYLRRVLPYRTEDHRIDGVVVTFTDITARKLWERQIQEAKAFAEKIVETIPLPLLVLTPELQVSAANAAFYRSFRVEPAETEGRLIYDLGNRQWNIPELRRLLDEVLPANHRFEALEVEHQFDAIGTRTMLLSGRRLDSAQLILLAIEDITERRQGEQRRELLMRELSHRVKNVFAVIQALASLAAGRGHSVAEFCDAFIGRLHALAKAHELLLETDWQATNLRVLVETAVEAYRVAQPDAVEIEGAVVSLTPKQALGLSLVLHELGTNAAKYGALSRAGGHMRVHWRIETEGDARCLHLLWEERDGPVVVEPTQAGFGTDLIERACSFELHGRSELNYRPEGLSCVIRFPLAAS